MMILYRILLLIWLASGNVVAAFVSSRSKNDLLVWIFVAVATPSSNVE
jgi:hypothetical protein